MTQISAQAQFERRDSARSAELPDEAQRHSGQDWRTREPVLTPQRKMRFLDELSRHGNVRVAAGRVGVSRSAVYLAQRRDAAFARGWRAALVLARDHAEAVLAERAIEGVEEEIWYRGELVGARRRYDGRLLLAHLARLDRLCAEDAAALADAARFDAVIGEVGELPEAEERHPETGEPLTWPARADFVSQARADAVEDARSLVRGDLGMVELFDAEAVDAAVAGAGAEWDAFHLALWQAVDAALVDGGGEDPLDCVQSVQSIACPPVPNSRHPRAGGDPSEVAGSPCPSPGSRFRGDDEVVEVGQGPGPTSNTSRHPRAGGDASGVAGSSHPSPGSRLRGNDEVRDWAIGADGG
ncbi:hypothetical protein OKA06_08495 [Novosphingobium sp. MW5]|nr:hypothetical protein [Novosphingobium sp. MW5]